MAFTARKPAERSVLHGEFEIYCSAAAYSVARSGDDIIELEFTVRPDVQQDHQNYRFRKTFWLQGDGQLKDGDLDKLGKYAGALGIEEGQEFDLDDLIGLSARLRSFAFTNDEGRTFDCIALSKSKADKPYTTSITPPVPAELDEDDEELPF